MVATTTRGGEEDPRRAGALSTATTAAPGGRILLPAGLWRAVLLPPGQRFPAPGARAPGLSLWYLTDYDAFVKQSYHKHSGCAPGKQAAD